MRTRFTVALMLLAAAVTARAQTSSSALLQSALYEQEVRGDLRAAMGLYRRIIANHAGDRPTAARALVQLALAYETLGNDSAARAYRRVLADYPEQREPAERARLRLASLERTSAGAGAPGNGIVTRQLWTTPMSAPNTQLSPDGRRVAFVDWGTMQMEGLRGHADLALYDLTTRRPTLVTDRPSLSIVDVYVAHVIWSPDGRRLAYTLWDTSWTHKDLYLVGADGRGNTLLVDNQQFRDLVPMEWSAAGGFIAALVKGWDDLHRIVLISTRDGASRVVKTLGAHPIHAISVSADGRHILYEYYQAEGTQDHDLFLLASDGSSEVRLAPHPADEAHGVFTPDGSRVVFLSRRSGQQGLWAVRVEGGRGAGEPELVRPNMGDAILLGFTRAGALAYRTPRIESDVFSGLLDLSGAGSLSDVQPLTTSFVGRNLRAVWSPDGSRVAFLSLRGDGWDGAHLVVRTIAGGEERSHRLPFRSFGRATRPAWTADASSVLLEGGGIGEPAPSDFRRVTYRVDVETGSVEPQPYLHHFVGGGSGLFRYASARQTGRLAEFGLRLFGQSDLRRLSAGDFAVPPGEQPMLVRVGVYRWTATDFAARRTIVAGNLHSWELSPDGNTLALAMSSDSAPDRSDALYVMPVDGGPLRELARVYPADLGINVVRWLPDGRSILFAARREGHERGDLWHVGLDGAAARRVELPLDWQQLAELDFGQDGRVAITTATAMNELWLMEGFPWQARASR